MFLSFHAACSEEGNSPITLVYVPSHLYYILFEVMKVSKCFILNIVLETHVFREFELIVYVLEVICPFGIEGTAPIGDQNHALSVFSEFTGR